MEVKISIIVPVYNLENYIQKCLESIQAQVYRDYEVIIINDGSTDRSREMIERFIAENSLSNFLLINQKNSGIAAARNVGLDSASGEWITFIDGDDWVEPEYLYAMYRALEKNPSDMCFAGYRAVDEAHNFSEIWSDFLDDACFLPNDLGKLYSFGYVWAHMYSAEIIRKHQLRFDENIYCEDSAFNLDYNSCIKSFCMTEQVVYNYRINRSGALTQILVHPNRKKRLYDHMQSFCDSFTEEELIRGVRENRRMARVMWNELYASITNNILDGEYKRAKIRRKDVLAKTILSVYSPRSFKEKIMLLCLQHSFPCLVFLSKLYYGNYEKLRKSKLLKFLSK